MRLGSDDAHITGVIGRLTDAGLLVGDGEVPDGAGWQGAPGQSSFVPYGKAYRISGSETGPISEPHDDLSLWVQLQWVGASASQARQVSDDGAEALLDGSLTLSGRGVLWVHRERETASHDDDPQPSLWYVPDRYLIATTPA